MYKIILGDCMEEMKKLEDESVDLILTDPPYGTIKGLSIVGNDSGVPNKRNEWDEKVEIKGMLEEFQRVLKPNGRALIFGNNGYTQELRNQSNTYMKYTYPLYWVKNRFGSPISAKVAPLSYIEDISVFSKLFGLKKKQREYMKKVFDYIKVERDEISERTGLSRGVVDRTWYKDTQFRIPSKNTYNKLIEEFNIQEMGGFMTHKELKEIEREESPSPVFNIPDGKGHAPNYFEVKKDSYGNNSFHPTQKPVLLMEQLIEMFSNEGDVVLDAFMGSGSTGVACINTDRKFIGIELDDEYYGISEQRLKKHSSKMNR